MASEKPTKSLVFSLIGGIFVLIGGLTMGVGGVSGPVGVLCGALVILFAVLLSANPKNHAAYGVLILLFSAFSWIGTLGGLVIGFVSGVIGGVLAIAWQPSAKRRPQAPLTQACPNCGRVIDMDTKHCPRCGTELFRLASPE